MQRFTEEQLKKAGFRHVTGERDTEAKYDIYRKRDVVAVRDVPTGATQFINLPTFGA